MKKERCCVYENINFADPQSDFLSVIIVNIHVDEIFDILF